MISQSPGMQKAILLYSCGFFLLLLLGSYQVFYLFGWTALSFGYLLLFKYAKNLALHDSRVGTKAYIILLLVLSLLLRSAFLLHPLQFSHDMESYLLSVKLWTQGGTPFSDEGAGNAYPPLAYLFWLAVFRISPTIAAMKSSFILADSLIPLVLFYLSKKLSPGINPYASSLLYAINPLSLIEVGWSGHFDVLPSITVLISLYLLYDGRMALSGFFLAAGMLFKWYPLFILPLAAVWAYRKKGLKESAIFTSTAAVFMLVSFGLMVYFYPAYLSRLQQFFFSGGNIWFCSRSIAEVATKLANSLSPGMLGRCLPTGFAFYLAAALVLIKYCSKGGVGKNTFQLVLLVLALHLTTLLLSHTYSLVFGLGATGFFSRIYNIYFLTLAIYSITLSGSCYKKSGAAPSLNETIIAVLLLVILGQPVFAPWYFLWLTPIVLLFRDRDKSFYLTAALIFTQPIFYFGPPYYFKALIP